MIALLAGCIKAVPGQAGDKIRVLVLKGVREVNIKGSDRGSLAIKREAPDRVLVNGKNRDLPIRLSPRNDVIYLNGKPFRGTLEVAEGKGGLMVVNELYLESYLVGIINNEISSKWPADVIKTQAIIARTYAIHQRRTRPKDRYHVEGTVMGQVYSGAGKEDAAALKAVKETAGEILTFDGEPALTVYHSNAGGMTEASSNIWFRDYPYLKPVESPYDETAPKFEWEFTLPGSSLRELLSAAGYRIGDPDEIRPLDKTASGRVRFLSIVDANGGGVKVSGEDLRRIIGYSTLKSTMFEVGKDNGVFVFKGRGAGHGVGLSQWGAKGMAENGYSYKEILKHYYPGTDLSKAY